LRFDPRTSNSEMVFDDKEIFSVHLKVYYISLRFENPYIIPEKAISARTNASGGQFREKYHQMPSVAMFRIVPAA